MSAQYEITAEQESGHGWEFSVQVLDERGQLRRHKLRLSWADYNHWSASGADEPGAVAGAVMQFLLARRSAEEIPDSFDASIARRLYADADEQIPGLI